MTVIGAETWAVPTFMSGWHWVRLPGGTRQFKRHVVEMLEELGGQRRRAETNIAPWEVCLILDGTGPEAQTVIEAHAQTAMVNDLPLAIIVGGEQFQACSSPKIAWLPSEVETCVFEWMLNHLMENGWRWSGGIERRSAPRLRLRIGISEEFELIDISKDGAQLGASLAVAQGSNLILSLSKIIPELDEDPLFHVIHTRPSYDAKPYRLHGKFYWAREWVPEELCSFLLASASFLVAPMAAGLHVASDGTSPFVPVPRAPYRHAETTTKRVPLEDVDGRDRADDSLVALRLEDDP